MRFARIGSLVAVSLVISSVPGLAGPASINQRQRNQQARIYNGIQTGELTRKEAENLEAREGRIAALEAKDRRTGGGLSPQERAQLQHDLNVSSRDIYRDKHNERERGGSN